MDKATVDLNLLRATADRVLAAVWRVEKAPTGATQGYALRFMLDPAQAPAAAAPRYAVADMAAAC